MFALAARKQSACMAKKPANPSLSAVLARNIRIYRAARGLSQEQLAELCGLKRTYIGSIERAEIDVRLSTLGKVAKGLEVEAGKLLSTAATTFLASQ